MKMVGLPYEAFNGYVREQLDINLQRFNGLSVHEYLSEWREAVESVLSRCMAEFKVDKIKGMEFVIETREGVCYPHRIRVVRTNDNRFEASWL